jgi:aryl-alcohol dehydrogenase (NADP+)
MLTGRARKGRETDLVRASFLSAVTDERRLDAVEQMVPLAEEAGLPMTHLAMAFAIAHPGVTCALLGARTRAHLDDLLAGLDVTLSDDVLDRIDALVAPGVTLNPEDNSYGAVALTAAARRR